jgi:hypothetical protein
LAHRSWAAAPTPPGRLSEQQMIDTHDSKRLITAANVIHYKVINAWRRGQLPRLQPDRRRQRLGLSDTAREVNTITTFRVTA